jgi:hypothetical protein
MGRAVVLVVVLLGTAAFAEGVAGETEGGKQPLLAAAVTSSHLEPVYAGTYVYAGSDAERAAVKAAVDRATEKMFGKVIAREELMKRSEIRPSYTIRLDSPGRVSVETPGFPSDSSPLDGTEVELRTKYGDVVKNSHISSPARSSRRVAPPTGAAPPSSGCWRTGTRCGSRV